MSISVESLAPRIETSKRQRITLERKRIDAPFWPAAIDILRTRETEALKQRVFGIAEASPHVPLDKVKAFVATLEKKYEGDTRKFTEEDEVNHALQVGILTAHAIGWNKLSYETFTTALGHDLFENTPDTQDEISERTQHDISRGIVALSHKNNGIKLYPKAKDKRPFFENLVNVHLDEPNLELPVIKVMDQIAVANSPLLRDELAEEQFEAKWKSLSEGKLEEMELYMQVLLECAPRETYAMQRLREGIAFTKLRMEPKAGAKVLGEVVFERRNQGV